MSTTELKDYQQRDVEDLARLFIESQEDGRTLSEMIADDPVDEYKVQKAVRHKDGWEVSFDDGLIGWFTTDKEIKVGDTLGLFTGGRGAFGYMRHGFSVNGEVIEWKTPFERFADRIAMLASHDREHRERGEQSRIDVNKWLAELRPPFSTRVQRFIDEKPSFYIDGGTYETYVVLMAQRIFDFVRSHHPDAQPAEWEDAVALIKSTFDPALSHKEQMEVVHAHQRDTYGISGFQFDAAKGMAARALMGAEI